ncbi:MAG: hypothetical protein WD673_08230 [Alphaproteobacteria bacterium]
MTTMRERGIARVRDMVLAALGSRKARVWLFGRWLSGMERRLDAV